MQSVEYYYNIAKGKDYNPNLVSTVLKYKNPATLDQATQDYIIKSFLIHAKQLSEGSEEFNNELLNTKITNYMGCYNNYCVVGISSSYSCVTRDIYITDLRLGNVVLYDFFAWDALVFYIGNM